MFHTIVVAAALLAGGTADRPLVVFEEPEFPTREGSRPAAVPTGALVAADGSALIELLAKRPDAILVWRHGSAFPAEAWPAFLAFLERGGDFVSLAGEPFTLPVTGPPGARRIERRTTAPLRELGLLHPRLEFAEVLTLEYRAGRSPALAFPPSDQGTRVAVLEPRFASAPIAPAEEGSPGIREAALRPIADLMPRYFVKVDRPTYAAAYAIDRLRGRFAGGRWVLRLLTSTPRPEEIERLLGEAARDPAELSATPTFACYHDGERPALRLRALAPSTDANAAPATWNVTLSLFAPGAQTGGSDAPAQRIETTIAVARSGESLVELPACNAPGLWRVRVECDAIDPFETGFEVLDSALLASGGPLEFRGDSLFRAGLPCPLIGTTLMSPDVHRAFLFEPNPAAWDREFAEVAAAKLNCVRTGMWHGWRTAMTDPGRVDEAFLRAVEAYALAARRHGVVLIFTFFAFLPEAWGGEHAFLDPRAVEAQRAFVTAIARRLAPCRELMFDLVNEPSFAPPSQMWRCRPSGTACEGAAFLAWLKARYSVDAESQTIEDVVFGGKGIHPRDDPNGIASPDAVLAAFQGLASQLPPSSWEDAVRARWHLGPGEPIALPALRDFEDAQVFADRRPERARDFLRFSQDAFTAWASDLREAIRASGSPALVTVGQDEGGLLERPHPLMHASAVDFTSIHSWWWNDSLLFDGLASKAHGKPLLVSETGIQPRELHDGSSLRNGHESALLLSRKLAAAFAARACGAIQWCWSTNPYMASDAESMIGLVRTDGSATWELAVMRGFADFVARNAARLEYAAKPEVAFVLPQTDLTGPRAMPKEGVSRALERLTSGLGLTVQVVPEWRPEPLREFDTIVVPAARGYRAPLVRELESALARGATVLISGSPFDDAMFHDYSYTIGVASPLQRFESITIDGRTFDLEFPLVAYESGRTSGVDGVISLGRGPGRVVACRLPIEWSLDGAAIEAFYRQGLGALAHPVIDAPPPGVTLTSIPLREGRLVVAINESSRGHSLAIGTPDPERESFYLEFGAGALLLLGAAGRVQDVTRW